MYSYCIYRSRSQVAATSAACAAIYLSAREANAALGVTGYLHHEDGFFVQFVEGSETAICLLLDTIENDLRHTGMSVLDRGQAAERYFPGWDMAFSHKETRAFETWARQNGCHTQIATAPARQILDFFLQAKAPAVAAPVV